MRPQHIFFQYNGVRCAEYLDTVYGVRSKTTSQMPLLLFFIFSRHVFWADDKVIAIQKTLSECRQNNSQLFPEKYAQSE